jgi:regulator of sigma E protease
VEIKEYYKLDRALQSSFGKPVTLTVQGVNGQRREVQITPVFFDPPQGFERLNFAGMIPRAQIVSIVDESSARGKLHPGDDVLSLTIKSTNDTSYNPSPEELRKQLSDAAKAGSEVDMTVLRDGKEVSITGLTAQVKLEGGAKGLGVAPGYDADHAVVGGVNEHSAAERSKVPPGATIVSVNGQPFSTWYDIHRFLSGIKEPTTVQVSARSGGSEKNYELELTQNDIDSIQSIRYTSMLALHELSDPRKTTNPVTAAEWGVIETRDLMVQFYLTLRRMFQGSVPASGAMGPIGIFHQGSKIAYRGTDWLIWFLAMISANLAVVNFLPIPIVDGGLFVFLIIEKVMRRPLSPRAQSIAQIVGLALIASVFLFVTYHDVLRMF